MSTLSKITIQAALLMALTAHARPAYSSSASAGVASPAPAATAAPSAAPAGPAPAAAVAGRPPGSQPLTRLQDLQNQSLARLQGLQNWLGPGSRTGTPILVIPAKEMPRETYDRIVEDLSVMGRIIEKSLHEAPDEAYGSSTTTSLYFTYDGYGQNLFLPSDGAGPQILRPWEGQPKAIYVGGYGAVFSLRVGFPLVAPPEAPKQEKATEPMDRVWVSAQRELADPQAAARSRRGGPAGEPYKPEAVENLKNTLSAILKHASNIRDLEPDSWLTLLVQGPATAPAEQPQDTAGNERARLTTHETGRTLLSLRARKADIDQFAKGQLDEMQFRQRVQIVAR